MTAAPSTASVDDERTRALDVLVALGDTEIVRRSWRYDEAGLYPSGIVSGPGAGESLVARLVNRYAPTSTITTHFYPVHEATAGRTPINEDDLPYAVDVMVTFTQFDRAVTDPGAAQIHTETRDAPGDQTYLTEAEALAGRHVLAAEYSPEYFTWNGDPLDAGPAAS